MWAAAGLHPASPTCGGSALLVRCGGGMCHMPHLSSTWYLCLLLRDTLSLTGILSCSAILARSILGDNNANLPKIVEVFVKVGAGLPLALHSSEMHRWFGLVEGVC